MPAPADCASTVFRGGFALAVVCLAAGAGLAAAAAGARQTDEVAPTLDAATVSGRVLTLAYDETLDAGSAPGAGDYAVTVDGVSRGIASAAVDGADVVLTLSSPAGLGDTVLISDASTSSSVSDGSGNRPAVLSDQPVKVLVNIVFILADDHAAQAVSAYGSTLVSTPNIDRLARDGVRFDRALAPNAICQPARATLLTGKYAHRHGVAANGSSFDGSQQQVQHLVGKAGFRTAMIGKWHLESDPRGFDHWEVLSGQGHYYTSLFKSGTGTLRRNAGVYTTDVITDKAIRWMKANRSAKRPFMAFVWHKAPHRPWDPAPADMDRFRDVQYPVPETFFDSYAGRASPLPQQQMRVDGHLDENRDLKLHIPQGYPRELWAGWVQRAIPNGDARTRAEWKLQTYLRDYTRVVHGLDQNVGRVLDYLDDSGLDESTLVVYASDQGFFLGEHGWFDKRWFHEESIRFPLIVRPPAGQTGSTVSAIVSQTDIAPTLLEAAGVEVPDDMQGRSLLPFLEGSQPDDWRTSFYYHYLECPGVHRVARHRAVVTERYKLVHYYQSGEWELFDRDVDARETDNVYADAGYADQVSKLKAELARLRTALGDVDGTVAGAEPAFLEGAAARRSLAENSVGRGRRTGLSHPVPGSAGVQPGGRRRGQFRRRRLQRPACHEARRLLRPRVEVPVRRDREGDGHLGKVRHDRRRGRGHRHERTSRQAGGPDGVSSGAGQPGGGVDGAREFRPADHRLPLPVPRRPARRSVLFGKRGRGRRRRGAGRDREGEGREHL